MQEVMQEQNALEGASLRRSAAKDLSLVTLVPKWGGADNAPPLAELFEAIEGTAKIGNWTEADKIQVCVLRLTDNARDFYRATPELRDPHITWEEFKAHFLNRFRDVRTAQYHFTQLQQARQRKNESASEFLDRCKILARRTVPSVTDAIIQRAYNDQADRMLLAAYSAGLTGTAGREVRMRAPVTTEEAVRIAITIEQAELQERKNNTFYMDSAVDISPSGRARERPARQVSAANTNSKFAPPSQPSSRKTNHRKPIRKAQSDAPVKCYECSGYGHFARDCANRKMRASVSDEGVKAANGGAKQEGHKPGIQRWANQPAEN